MTMSAISAKRTLLLALLSSFAVSNVFGCFCSSFNWSCDNTNSICQCSVPWQTCDYAKCCKTRRLIEEDSGRLLASTDPDYNDYLTRCGKFDYEALLVVEHKHFHAVALPSEEAADAGCPFVAAHAVTPAGKSNILKKELLVWDSKEQGKAAFGEEGTLPIGNFKLSEMVTAFEETDPGASGAYDIVSNSCADFVIGMGTKLGVKIDSRVTSFVTRRLIETGGKELFGRIKKSVSYLSLFQNRRNLRADTATEEDVIKLLVDAHGSALF